MAEYQYYDLSSGGEDDFEAMPTVTYSLGSCVLEDPEESYLEDERWVPKPLYVQAQVNADEDDDWNSDPEVCAPVQLSPPAVSAVEMSGRKPFMDYEDDVWVDEAKGTFNTHKTSDLTKVTELLREMFDVHDDVYTLLLAFLNRTGKVRMQKKSLPRIVITEFQAWLGEQQEKPKNAILTAKHRKEALQVLTKCHSVLMDDLTAIFELHSAEKTSQLDLIDSLLVQDRLKEAVTYTWKFGLQEHFEMRTMLLPLVALDKINLIENYIDGSRKLQEEFVGILDDLCEPGTTQAKINSFLSTCTLGPKSMDRDVLSKGNCKLNFKQLYRLAHRMVSKYSLDMRKFSHIHRRWSIDTLLDLLETRYMEGTITEDNMDDLLEPLVKDSKSLQLQLVKELLRFNDTSAAVKWVVKCDLPVDQLPYEVHAHLNIQSPPSKKVDKTPPEIGSASEVEISSKKELSLPLSSVVFVDQKTKLDSCWDAIKKPHIAIWITTEWTLSGNRGRERLAVLQLAVKEVVYLLDMVHLPRVVGESVLRDFMITLLHSEHSLKLGYGIQCDLHMLSKSWPFIGDIVCTLVKVLDLQKLEKMVEQLIQKRYAPMVEALPAVQQTSHDLSCNSKLSHLLLSHSASKPTECQTGSQNGGELVRDDPYEMRREGLTKLVKECFNKSLDNSQQLSDWEKRPLTAEQITYAALHAHCLLGVYKYLLTEAVTYDPSFSLRSALIS